MTRNVRTRQNQRIAGSTWVGVALAVALLLAESLALTHPLDSAAHTNGQQCSICLSVAPFGAGAVSTPVAIQLDAATPAPVAAATLVRRSISVQRRFARGPPIVSFVA